MRDKNTFGSDFLKRLFPTIKWDGSRDVNFLKRMQKDGQDGLYLLVSDHFDSLTDDEKENAADILAEFEKHPTGNICEPALPFPFTIKELIAFLECYRDFYNRMFERDRFFTIEDIACFLKMAAIDVFMELRIGNESGRFLAPSVYLSKPISVNETEGDGTIQQIKGLFEIDGARGVSWTNKGVRGVNLFTRYEPCKEPWGAHYQPLWLARRQFMLSSGHGTSIKSLSFNRSKIVISHFAFLDYLWANHKNGDKPLIEVTEPDVMPSAPLHHHQEGQEDDCQSDGFTEDQQKDVELSGREADKVTQAAVTLSNKRHNGRRPTEYFVSIIIDRIKAKQQAGEYWHQTSEIVEWLREKKDNKFSLQLFKEEVNERLLNLAKSSPEFKPKNGAPRGSRRK